MDHSTIAAILFAVAAVVAALKAVEANLFAKYDRVAAAIAVAAAGLFVLFQNFYK
ncbi:MAG: hypothetical protein M3P43_02250 [Actinomycetota bacterium]|nr:hypothetical protein [Actinomycetota bacterium]